jgi:hypothetical protein
MAAISVQLELFNLEKSTSEGTHALPHCWAVRDFQDIYETPAFEFVDENEECNFLNMRTEVQVTVFR